MPMIKQFSENGPVGVLKRCRTISAGRTRALTAPHPIKPTSPRCRSAWQPNLGSGSTYRCGKSVQTTGTTSLPQASCHQGSEQGYERAAAELVDMSVGRLLQGRARRQRRLGHSAPTLTIIVLPAAV